MTPSQDFSVVVSWEAEKRIFFVVESEIAGLWAEAATMAELLEIIEDVAPDLIRANHPDAAGRGVRILEDRGRLVAAGA